MNKAAGMKLTLASVALAAGLLSSAPAFADWHGRGGWGGGDHIGISLGFGYPGYYGYPAYGYYPYYVAPPPTVVYAAPPQVVYAPAPATYVQPAAAPVYAQPAPAQAPQPAGNSAYPGYIGQ